MSIVLDKYGIRFYGGNFKSRISGASESLPLLSTTDELNYILIMFFEDYFKVDDIQTYILDIVNDVMNNSIIEGETGSQSGIAVYIKSDVTKFVYFGGRGTYLNPNLTMPTADFNQLAVEWKAFIVSYVARYKR
jgi:hypothetical protein